MSLIVLSEVVLNPLSVLLEPPINRKLKHHDISDNGQVIPANSNAKFIGITRPEIQFALARHSILKINSIFSSYGPSTIVFTRLDKSCIRSVLYYGTPVAIVAAYLSSHKHVFL